MTYGEGSDSPPAPPPPPPSTPPATPPAGAPPPGGYQAWGTPPPPRRRTGLIIGAVVGGVVALFVLVIVALTVVGHKTSDMVNTSYTDPQNLFSAKFEGTPKYQSQTVSSAAGDVPVNLAEYSAPGVDEFVGVIIPPPGSTFDLQAALSGMAGRVSGTVTSSSPTKFQGYDAIEGVISTTDSGVAKCTIVHTDSDEYMICAVGSSNPPGDYAPLLASVKLTPHH